MIRPAVTFCYGFAKPLARVQCIEALLIASRALAMCSW